MRQASFCRNNFIRYSIKQNCSVRAPPQAATQYINVNIKSDENETTAFSIFNSLGNQVRTVRTELHKGDNQLRIDNLSALSAGIYMLKTKIGGIEISKKIMIGLK